MVTKCGIGLKRVLLIICKVSALVRTSMVKLRENFLKQKLHLACMISKNHLVKADLICVQFDINEGHPLIHSVVLPCDPVHCLWNKLKNKIEIKLVPFSGWKEVMLKTNDVRMIKHMHDLQLSVLVTLILKNLFYRNNFSCFSAFGLKR